jgi:hypothetical protein
LKLAFMSPMRIVSSTTRAVVITDSRDGSNATAYRVNVVCASLQMDH